MMNRKLALLVGLAIASFAASVGNADDGDDLFALAAGYYNQQRWDAAAEKMQQLLRDHPQHAKAPEAAFFLGEALMQGGRYDEAQAQLQAFLERWPDRPRAAHATFRTGEAAFLMGQTDAARTWLTRFIERYPREPLREFALTYLGELDLADTAWASAQQRFEAALKDWPQGAMSERCRFGLGRAFDGRGEVEEAKRFYRHVGWEGQSELADEALFNLAVIHYHESDLEQVTATVQRLTKNYGDQPLAARGWYLLGRGQQRAGELNAAVTSFEAGLAPALENHWDVAPALLYELALTHQDLGQPTVAEPIWRQILETFPESEFGDDAYQQQIQTAFGEENWGRVETLTREFLDQYPESPWLALAREYLGRTLLAEEKFADAAVVFRELLADTPADALQPEQLPFAYLLGLSLVRQREFAEAVPYLEATCRGSEDRAVLAGGWLALETAYAGLQQHQDVVRTAAEYLERFPQGLELARVRRDQCLALVALGDWEAADRALTAYLADHSEHAAVPETVQRMADLAYQANEFAYASRWFGELVERQQAGGDQAVVYLAVAWSKAREGDAAEAQAWFERLIREYPEHPLTAQAFVETARYAQEQSDWSTALAAYRKAWETFPGTGEAQQARLAGALVLMKLGSTAHLHEAIDWLQPLVDQDPPCEQLDLVHYQLAWAYRDTEQSAAALAHFQKLVENWRDSKYRPDALYRLAEAAARDGERELASQWIETLRRDHPDQGPHDYATYLRAQLAAADQDWPRLIDEATTFRERWPEHELQPAMQFWQAEAWYRQREFELAKPALESLRDELGASTSRWVPVVYLRIAQLAAIEEEWTSVREACAELRERFPEFQQAYEIDYLEGRYHAARGEFTAARNAYQRVIRSPEGRQTETAAMAQWMIGESYFHQEAYRDAIEAYHRVATLYPFPQWQAAALLQSGKCHEQLRQYQHAVTLYAQLLRDHPQSSYAQEASQRLSIAKQRQGAAAETK